jgi:1-deoxy-D-xylulose-5-phosphate reductoisomerase
VTTRPPYKTGVAILGSTGSVGRQTLDVIESYHDRFRVVALAARSPSDLFQAQVAKYNPALVSVSETSGITFPPHIEVLAGDDALVSASVHPDVDIVVVATSGHAAILPTMRAIEQGKTIALANKETLVCAGEIIMPLAEKHGVQIRPVDSEHSAIWQVLGSTPTDEVRNIILTASGGPFRSTPANQLASVTPEQALAHPTWRMGPKITIDSATLMNKGLEVIEAHWLFDLDYDRIAVVIHPESHIHSLVEFNDGSLIAQLGTTDMRGPIQYALTYPKRFSAPARHFDLVAAGDFHFENPDDSRFPALRLARESGLAGKTFPTVLSAADDEAVAAFLAGMIRFTDIADVVERVLDRHKPEQAITIESIAAADRWARQSALNTIAKSEAARR